MARNGVSLAKSCWLPAKYTATTCSCPFKVDRLSAYSIWQHPAFVTSAQAQFLLLIISHPPVDHIKSSVFCSINIAVERRFETLPSDIILYLLHARLANLRSFAVLFINIVTLWTQRNYLAAFTFMFEQPQHTPAPRVLYKPLLLLSQSLHGRTMSSSRSANMAM